MGRYVGTQYKYVHSNNQQNDSCLHLFRPFCLHFLVFSSCQYSNSFTENPTAGIPLRKMIVKRVSEFIIRFTANFLKKLRSLLHSALSKALALPAHE